MNILFLVKTFGIGGVEIVTLSLAKALRERGHQVGIFTFLLHDEILCKQVPDDISFYISHGLKERKSNEAMLRQILVSDGINLVINQWGLSFMPIRLINKARQGLGIKVISVYHMQVNMNGRLASCDKAISNCSNRMLKPVLKLKRRLMKLVTSRSMRYVYNHSDIYEVLSPSFVGIFKEFTGIKNPAHLVVQTNPVTIAHTQDFILDVGKKQKEIIYVGRLDMMVKRVERVIDTWGYLEEKFPDWQLTIVGDGEDRQILESYVKNLGLKRVSFEGFQQPSEYYKRASMLLLTSEYEGFPLILPECMSFGVIPVVYDSYAAVRDIIEDHRNGIIIPSAGCDYDANAAANLIAGVMNDDRLRGVMAANAIEKSKQFSLENICDEWEKIFSSL